MRCPGLPSRARVLFRLLALAGFGLALALAASHPARTRSAARSGLSHGTRLLQRSGLQPGSETTNRDALHPAFQAEVARVEARLQALGHQVRVTSAWRSPRRQDSIWLVSQLIEKLGGSPGTRVRGGDSCHNQLLDGQPASAAIDLHGAAGLSLDEQAAFFQALGQAAEAEGLRWGGRWSRSNPTWARYDLGWDPAHIEDPQLCRRLRR